MGLLMAGLAELGGDERLKDSEHSLPKRQDDFQGLVVPRVVAPHELPARDRFGGDVNIPAQAFERVASQEETVEEGSLPVRRDALDLGRD